MKSTFYAITFWLPMCLKDTETTDHLLLHCQTMSIVQYMKFLQTMLCGCSPQNLGSLVQWNACQVPKQANQIWKASPMPSHGCSVGKKCNFMIYEVMMNFYGAVHDNWANDESSWSSIMSLLGFWVMQFKE